MNIGELGKSCKQQLSSASYLTVYSQAKQAERANIIADLPAAYKGPVSEQERSILEKPVSELVRNVQNHTTQPIDILRAYGKVALKAHEKTNCLTEVMITDAAARAEKKTSDVHGPLAGIPISLKDTVGVKGFDASVGYSSYTGKPWAEDGAMVRLLRDAGQYHSPTYWWGTV